MTQTEIVEYCACTLCKSPIGTPCITRNSRPARQSHWVREYKALGIKLGIEDPEVASSEP